MNADRSGRFWIQGNAVGRGEALVEDVAGVSCCSRLEENDTSLFLGASPVLCSAWDDTILARAERNDAIAEFDSDLAAPDQKHFILNLVLMPRKLALELNQFHFLSIKFSDDSRPPMLRDT